MIDNMNHRVSRAAHRDLFVTEASTEVKNLRATPEPRELRAPTLNRKPALPAASRQSLRRAKHRSLPPPPSDHFQSKGTHSWDQSTITPKGYTGTCPASEPEESTPLSSRDSLRLNRKLTLTRVTSRQSLRRATRGFSATCSSAGQSKGAPFRGPVDNHPGGLCTLQVSASRSSTGFQT